MPAETSLPAIKPYRSGRKSCPPDLLGKGGRKTASKAYGESSAAVNKRVASPTAPVIAFPDEAQGFARLTGVLKHASDRAVAIANGDVDVGFDLVAKHLEAFGVDTHADSTNEICRGWIEDALSELQPEEPISEPVAAAASMALDQLLALLLYREPKLQAITTAVREIVHRSIFPLTSKAMATKEAGNGGSLSSTNRGGVGTSSSSAMGTVSRVPQLLLRADELAVEELKDEYRDRRCYFGACATLLEERRALQKRGSALSTAIERHKKHTNFFQRQKDQTVLAKAFSAWWMQARRDHELNSMRTAVIEKQDKADMLGKELNVTKVRSKAEVESVHARQQLLNDDRHAMRKSYDAFQAIAERSRAELAVVKEELRTVKQVASQELQGQLTAATQQATKWRLAAQAMRFSVSDNPFENFNRERCSAVLTMEPGEAALLSWCEKMVEPFPDHTRAAFGQYQDRRVAATYVLLLHALSPGEVPYSGVSKAFESGAQAQGQTLAHFLTSLSMEPPIEAISQIHRRPREEHLLFLSMLFVRFCGVGATSTLTPPLAEYDLKIWEGLDGFKAAMQRVVDTPAANSISTPSHGNPHPHELSVNALQVPFNSSLTQSPLVTPIGRQGSTATLSIASPSPNRSALVQPASPPMVKDRPFEDPSMFEFGLKRRFQNNQRWAAFASSMASALGAESITSTRTGAGRAVEQPGDAERLRVFYTLDTIRVAHDLGEEPGSMAMVCQDVLQPKAPLLRRIFTNYGAGATRRDGSAGMAVEDLLALCQDAHITSAPKVSTAAGDKPLRTIKQSIVSAIFSETTRGESVILPRHFAEAIVRIAAAMPSSTLPDGGESLGKAFTGGTADDALALEDQILAEKLEYLVNERLLLYANGVAMHDFKLRIRGGPVADVLTEYKAIFRRLFRFYADDGSGVGTVLTEKDFLKFAGDGRLIDEVCTQTQLMQLFNKLPESAADAAPTTMESRRASLAGGSQRLSNAGSEGKASPTNKPIEQRESGLRLEDFVEVIVGIAIFKQPSPFMSMHQKVRKLIQIYLSSMPAAQSRKKSTVGR